jgi:nitroreductase
MEFYDVLRKRRSIRKYKLTPVEQDKIDRMLEAVRLAPSAKNIQPWHFLVIKDENTRRALGEAYPREWFAEAPVLICVCGEPAKAWVRRDGKSYLDVDAAIAFEHLILAAAAEGLGTCWIGAFDAAAVKRALGLPEGIEPIAMTPVGYADEAPRTFSRRTIADFVRLDRW